MNADAAARRLAPRDSAMSLADVKVDDDECVQQWSSEWALPQPQQQPVRQQIVSVSGACSNTAATARVHPSKGRDAVTGSFSAWAAVGAFTTHTAIHTLPFLRFALVRLQRSSGRANAQLLAALLSVSVGLAAASNRRALVPIFNPTPETAAVYRAIAVSLLLLQIIPRIFSALHFVCIHVPIVGGILVFLTLLFAIGGMFVAMLFAVGAYTVDVTITVHGCLKRMFGFSVKKPERAIAGRQQLRGRKNLSPVTSVNLADLPASYVGF
ncbi:hypothetical protein HDU83_001052 [Entophlyctis luteolus]|nr:hypothetical protein HDU83_001052 [Entophlyctis luteolus]